jgi:hypothetical protein
MQPELQRQTNPDPPRAHKSGITWRPIPPFELPFLDQVEPHQKVGWRTKFEYPSQPYPVLTAAIPHGNFRARLHLPLHLRSGLP